MIRAGARRVKVLGRPRCAVCGHGRWFHWLVGQPFHTDRPVVEYLRALDRIAGERRDA